MSVRLTSMVNPVEGSSLSPNSQTSSYYGAVLLERSALFMSVWMSGKDGRKPWRQECISKINQAHFSASSLLIVFFSYLFLFLNSPCLFLSLRPSLISLPSPPLHFLILPMASSFVIFTAASSAVSVCSSILVLPICPLSSPSAPLRGETNFNLSLDQSLS